MNTTEAIAVNTLLGWFVGAAGRPVAGEKEIAAASLLADRSREALGAGLTGEQVRQVLVDQLPPPGYSRVDLLQGGQPGAAMPARVPASAGSGPQPTGGPVARSVPRRGLTLGFLLLLWFAGPAVLVAIVLFTGADLLDGFMGSPRTNTPLQEDLVDLGRLLSVVGGPAAYVASVVLAILKWNTDRQRAVRGLFTALALAGVLWGGSQATGSLVSLLLAAGVLAVALSLIVAGPRPVPHQAVGGLSRQGSVERVDLSSSRRADHNG